MTLRTMLFTVTALLSLRGFAATKVTHLIEVKAETREERSRLADLGFALEEITSGKAYIYGQDKDLAQIQAAGFSARSFEMKPEWLRWTKNPELLGDNEHALAAGYHSYDDVKMQLAQLAQSHSDIMQLSSMGKSVQGRELTVVRISSMTVPEAVTRNAPVAMFMGCHHAREHLSVEMPLMLIQYLVNNYATNPDVKRLVDSREIYVAPIINPDGHVFDFKRSGGGNMWRKNRQPNSDGTFGVDLNRNYGFGWGTGGSSTDPDSDVYMGPRPFSEPESQAVRDFVLSQPRMTTLLSLHSFSELVLYPWGHTFDPIGRREGKAQDLPVFEKMARDMAAWNHYTPEQSSGLYIASGDTTDWAYGERGIFAFTIELTPTSMWSGGFYPEPTVIKPTFEANIRPFLYLIEYADSPNRVLTEKIPSFLVTPIKIGLPIASFRDIQF